MKLNHVINFLDNLFHYVVDVLSVLNSWSGLIGVVVSVVIAIYVHKLSKRLSAKERYEHELRITEAVSKFPDGVNLILADSKKYDKEDPSNESYRKQGAGLFNIIPAIGIEFMQRPTAEHEGVPFGLVPFEWIEYVRDYDSEDNKPIIVCKFNGVKWYKNFKSPFKEINYYYKNQNFREGQEPYSFSYTHIKPDRSHLDEK